MMPQPASCYASRRSLTLYQPFLLFTTVKQRTFEKIVGKGENAGNQHFLHFQQCFLPFPNQISIFHSCLSSANAFNLDRSKILSFGQELSPLFLHQGSLYILGDSTSKNQFLKQILTPRAWTQNVRCRCFTARLNQSHFQSKPQRYINSTVLQQVQRFSLWTSVLYWWSTLGHAHYHQRPLPPHMSSL